MQWVRDGLKFIQDSAEIEALAASVRYRAKEWYLFLP